MFEREVDLVDVFVAQLEDARPWGVRDIGREFDYGRGRTDLVVVLDGGVVIAIEAKLERWRYGLQQAYRNTCFAHHSYVLLPAVAATVALRYMWEFQRRGVGLCTVRDGVVDVLIDSARAEPVQPWLSRKAALACAASS